MMRHQFRFSRQTTFGALGIPTVPIFMGFLVAHASSVWAECPPEPPPVAIPANESVHSAAHALFKAGIELRDQKNWKGALSFFLQSRAIERRVSSTWNAAHCLNLLKRYPEALAFYEEVKRDFSDELSETKKAVIEQAIQDLQSKIFIANMPNSGGIYAVDGQTCGELPRPTPIYLFPGHHRLQIWQPGKPEIAFIFQGKPGERTTVQLPVVVPPKGQWFVQGTAGVGFGGAESSEFVGFLAQTRDGYRFPNQLSLALVMGMFYGVPSTNAEERKDFPSDENDVPGTVKPYFLRKVPLFGPFMGVSAGWEPRIDTNFKASFRIGVGVMAVQSKSEIDIVRGNDRHSVDDENGISVIGRDVVRTNPPYTTFDVGLMFHRKQFSIGASLGVFYILDNGTTLPKVPVRLDEDNRSNTITFEAKEYAYLRSFLFLPQIVVGFDP